MMYKRSIRREKKKKPRLNTFLAIFLSFNNSYSSDTVLPNMKKKEKEKKDERDNQNMLLSKKEKHWIEVTSGRNYVRVAPNIKGL